MLQRVIGWAVDNPLIVILMGIMLGGFGGLAFVRVNVEAYPDPAPAIVEVIAQYPGASAEEIERQVTIPLEVTLAGMPGLKTTRTRSLFGLSNLRCQFEYDVPYEKAQQTVINRLQFTQALPSGVIPVLSPTSPTGEIYRYTLSVPKDASGADIYTLNDIKALQDWSLEREFRRVPRIIDVTSAGGTVKRYEIRPDPDRLRRYGVTLGQFQSALASANQNTGGDVLAQGGNAVNVRGIGLYGGGLDPMQSKEVLGATDPAAAAAKLRSEDDRRLRALRDTVVTTINNTPVRVEDLVEGGPLTYEMELGARGVVVGNQTRLGRVSLSTPKKDGHGNVLKDADGNVLWNDEEEKVQCIVLLRKGEDSLPALAGVHTKVDELNDANGGRLLPGVKIEPYYDRTDLINLTTETVRENLVVGIALVSLILLVFLGNVRVAMIVAINIPLALLFAFAVLYVRGRSANLLSIGAVDFGIIVDSSVIMAENIYRKLTSGEDTEESLRDRILHSSGEIQRALLFSTAIMVCAFIPLFAMKGAEGQLFGPMADTYAFALAGGLMLAVVLTPVLCKLLLGNVRPTRDNFLVRGMKHQYLWALGYCLRFRWLFVAFMLSLLAVTGLALGGLGREFMPELEEGNLWVRGMYPRNASLDNVAEGSRAARAVMRKYPEIDAIANQMGRPDDGTDPEGFYKSEFFVPLKPRGQWPATKPATGWYKWLGDMRPRTKQELVAEMTADLRTATPGVDWNFSQNIRDNVMESISGVKGDNSVKIYGPDLNELQRLAELVEARLHKVPGVEDVGVLDVMGQPNLELPWDPEKCKRWGVSVADLQNVIQTAVGGQAATQMREGEKIFDVTLRWPQALRDNERAILDIPVDILNHQVSGGYQAGTGPTRTTGGAVGLTTYGSTNAMPSLWGSQFNAVGNYLGGTPRRRLGDLITPYGPDGKQTADGSFVRPGASMIFREQGRRMIAVKFSVRGRDLAGAVEDAKKATADLIPLPYKTEWGGEFEQMKDSEARLLLIIPIALALIFVLLYLAFGSLLDALVVLSNVVALSVGGIWALLITGTNFSTSAAVGFVSLFGVAIMGGLLMVSYFNALRAQGLSLDEAIRQGAEKRVRPVVMTGMTAILGLLPAALALRPETDVTGHFRLIEPIGVQTQRPLAIVVVGGMITSLLLTQYLMPVLYSFYGHREPPAGSGSMAH
ncbi:efflux RND transporter permease subunit [Fimbriiglobus ruber]|uniref:Cobalt-zinc-cadmium resistance protein CzcA / Cation efflux system protein CusA n=1 Tax=Fimbriiglobus ruber TaxID=1908690 RepID=A0A225D2S9_9BACT|nr:efflux RND transporter permease subunit [Fimbriiglobus ruber]OWK35891.1 Cobalt-zinc-cadmium resistance protein CzcA / Cation efflux system protein CusA [Fimbriiglobus ruber]